MSERGASPCCVNASSLCSAHTAGVPAVCGRPSLTKCDDLLLTQIIVPLMVTVFFAKLVGDALSFSIYDTHIKIRGAPVLVRRPSSRWTWKSSCRC